MYVRFPALFGAASKRRASRTVLMPSMTKTGERIPFAPLEERDGLYQRYRTGHDREILTLHNKSPQWNEGGVNLPVAVQEPHLQILVPNRDPVVCA